MNIKFTNLLGLKKYQGPKVKLLFYQGLGAKKNYHETNIKFTNLLGIKKSIKDKK